jgi:hypothetical protein
MPGPDLTPDEIAEGRRKAAAKRTPEQQAIMDAYVADNKSRPATTMSHDEQVADFTRRALEAKARRTAEAAKAREAKAAADRASGAAPAPEAPAGSLFKARALAKAGDLAKAGQATRSGAQTVLDATDTTAAKVVGVGAKIATGGDVHGIIQNAAVLTDLSGQAMIANDASIKQGYEDSVARNEASSAELQDKVSAFQSAPVGTAERRAGALKAFKSAGWRVRDQAELGAYQDLTMRTGPEEYSQDEVLGKAAPKILDYDEGDVVKREDAAHGSFYGKAKRAIQTGGLSTSGKLTDEQKAHVGKLQQELDDEEAARKTEHEGRNHGSMYGRAKRLVTFQGSKLTDDEKDEIERINTAKAAHATNAKAAEAQLREPKEQIRKQIEALKGQQHTFAWTSESKAHNARIQEQIDALQPSLDEGRRKLQAHRDETAAAQAEFDGQVGDIHARASGGFTRAETAARDAKQRQITDVLKNATAAENFTDEHAGKTINHYGRVGGMIERMQDPTKMEPTTAGTIADYVNKGAEHVEDAGKMAGGSADDSRDLKEQGKYLKSTVTSMVGVGMETAKLAGAPVGAGLAGDGVQKVVSSTLKGAGKGVQALTADAAAEERERTHSRDVVSGARREELKKASFVTTRRPDKKDPTLAGALGDLAKGALAMDPVKDAIMEGVGLGDNEEDAGPSGDDEKRSAVAGPKDAPDAGDGKADVGGDRPDLSGQPHGDVPDLSGEPHEVGHEAGGDVHQELGGGHPVGGDEHAGGVEKEPAAGGGPVVEDKPVVGGDEPAAGGGPVVEDKPVVGGDEPAAGGGPVVEDKPVVGGGDEPAAGGDNEHAGGEEEGAGKEEEGAHDPRAEEEKPFGEKVADNAKGEAYEMAGDRALDAGADKVDNFVAAPVVQAKDDVRVLHPQVPAPGPNPAPRPKKDVPWWMRIWRAIKRGARAVGRGAMRAGRAVGRGAMRVGRAVKRGFSSMGRRIRSWFS